MAIKGEGVVNLFPSVAHGSLIFRFMFCQFSGEFIRVPLYVNA